MTYFLTTHPFHGGVDLHATAISADVLYSAGPTHIA